MRMLNKWLLAVLVLSLSSVAFADSFTYSSIVVPGQTFTVAFGINNAGQIVGGYSCCAGSS